MDAPANSQSPPLLYMLHCGLQGVVLGKVCERLGLDIQIRQFREEHFFAYQMRANRQGPDLILVRGHFIGLVNELDLNRNIPYLVVSSKEKYGVGQKHFLHANLGYDTRSTLPLYKAIAGRLKEMISSKTESRPAESR